MSSWASVSPSVKWGRILDLPRGVRDWNAGVASCVLGAWLLRALRAMLALS